MATLVVVGGLPGTGKSALTYRLARERGWALLSKDQIDRSLELVEMTNFWAGYEVLFGLARLNLQNNVSVVLDAVFRLERLRVRAREIAEGCGATLATVVCSCSDEAIWQERIATRPAMVEGWTPVDWERIQRMKKRYTEWVGPHLALDAMELPDANYARMVEYLDSFQQHEGAAL